MSENEKRPENAQEAAQETLQAAAQADPNAARNAAEQAAEAAMEAVRRMAKGKLELMKPIEDGAKVYTSLQYDFNMLSGWEMARAIDQGSDGKNTPNDVNDAQAFCLFAAAAAKCTGGLDAKDIRERMGPMDAIAAINLAALFFRGSLLAANARITNA